MKLKKKLTTKQFIFSQFLILLTGLTFLSGLSYILNVQYQTGNSPFLNGPVTTAPKTLRLDLDHPDDNSLTFENSILVSGKTSPLKEVLIFTDFENQVYVSKKDGSFSTTIKLAEGENRITAVVFDPTGDVKSEQRTIYYSKEEL